MNKVVLIGRLGKDPELSCTPSGTPLAKFTLATSRKFTDRDGQRQEKTDWHRIVAWRKLAEICGQYLTKGRQVMIEGRIEYGSYEKDGVKHYTTDIIADNMEMLGTRFGNGPAEPLEPSTSGVQGDDIPF
jgi:single-strand DNA-binding protein